ncbi:MAG: hypothetical protein M5T61_04950 [Acidimicrobiia bacterium]|nr:hypothetical protein [Acidimicrobiia bacterium]
MFVEVVRMFVVVLGTAAGFWLARDLGDPGSGIEGVGGILGCLAGYVGGGRSAACSTAQWARSTAGRSAFLLPPSSLRPWEQSAAHLRG